MEVQFLGRLESFREWLGRGGWCPVIVREFSLTGRLLLPSSCKHSCHASNKNAHKVSMSMYFFYFCRVWVYNGNFAPNELPYVARPANPLERGFAALTVLFALIAPWFY